jgi:lipopolysaccharide/colanic/teichoic acid biosynthesis glycosyltransferase
MLRPLSGPLIAPSSAPAAGRWPVAYALTKRLFDVGFSALVLTPCLLVVAACLLVLNPVLNPGPLFYRPLRMGQDCRPFRLYKFRTMLSAGPDASRGPNDPLETERMTRLGAFLRRARFDELPQIINVFHGEMSLIGPRPDDLPHARFFLKDIPRYRQRLIVRPGITGLAQVELGYLSTAAMALAERPRSTSTTSGNAECPRSTRASSGARSGPSADLRGQ